MGSRREVIWPAMDDTVGTGRLSSDFRLPIGNRPCLSPRAWSRASSGRFRRTTAAVARETHPCFQRRLPRGYSQFGDARPGRHQIGSGCSTGQGDHTIRNRTPNGTHVRPRPEDHQRLARRLGRVRPSSICRTCHRSISGRSQRLGRPRPRLRTGRGMSEYRCRYWLTVLR